MPPSRALLLLSLAPILKRRQRVRAVLFQIKAVKVVRWLPPHPHAVPVCFGILNIFLFVFTTASAHFQTDASSEKLFGAVGEQIKNIFHCHVQCDGSDIPARKTTPGDRSPPICIPTVPLRCDGIS